MSTCYPIIINQSNLVVGSTNTYQYNFSSNVDMTNIDIGLSSVSLWFSWPNITITKNNNNLNVYFTVSAQKKFFKKIYFIFNEFTKR